MSCHNDNCDNDTDGINAIHIGDGDFVCCKKCKEAFEKQRDHFFNVTVHDEKLTEDYILGK